MPAVVIFNHPKSYTQRHLSLQHARDKSSIFGPKHLHVQKCISGYGVDVKEVRSRDFDRRDFDIHPWLLVVWNPPQTVGLKEKGQRLGVETKRLGTCLGFDFRDRSLSGKAGH